MSVVNIGDLIATSMIVLFIGLFSVSLFLFSRTILRRSTAQQKNDRNVAQALENIQQRNKEIIDLLKKMQR